jgi:hypothetical protein
MWHIADKLDSGADSASGISATIVSPLYPNVFSNPALMAAV